MEQTPTQLEPIGSHFDYAHQAWTFNGRYVRCGHPDSMNCDCYGKLHQGQRADVNDLPTHLEDLAVDSGA